MNARYERNEAATMLQNAIDPFKLVNREIQRFELAKTFMVELIRLNNDASLVERTHDAVLIADALLRELDGK